MARFAIVATFEIAHGQMDAFLPLLMAHRDRCLKDEPGTLRFDGCGRNDRDGDEAHWDPLLAPRVGP